MLSPFPLSPFPPEKLALNLHNLLFAQRFENMAKRPSLPRPVAVKDVLQELLNPGDRDALELRQRVRQVWEETVPAALLEQTRLVDLRRKELWVEVRDHLWGQELQFLRTAILEELARVLGPGKVKDLRIRVGEF